MFGHIHEAHGLVEQEWARDELQGARTTVYANAASVDLSLNPLNEPLVIDALAL